MYIFRCKHHYKPRGYVLCIFSDFSVMRIFCNFLIYQNWLQIPNFWTPQNTKKKCLDASQNDQHFFLIKNIIIFCDKKCMDDAIWGRKLSILRVAHILRIFSTDLYIFFGLSHSAYLPEQTVTYI